MTQTLKGKEIQFFAGYACIPCSPDDLGELEQDKEYEVSIKAKRKKRSLDANAYYWELCGKLAQALKLKPDEIYRQHIHDIGNYETYCIIETALDRFRELWCGEHTGRQVSTRASKIEGCVTVLAYYGSSDFDTIQMTQLIENCVQDCKALGIETRPQEEVDSLLRQWSEKSEAKTDKGN